MYFGMPVSIPYDNLQGVVIRQGETPLPETALQPVPSELRNAIKDELKIIDGIIVSRTQAEIDFSRLTSRYKKLVDGLWVEMTAEEKRVVDLPDRYKNSDGSEMTPEQKAAVDAAELAVIVAEEEALTFDQTFDDRKLRAVALGIISAYNAKLPAQYRVSVAELKAEVKQAWLSLR